MVEPLARGRLWVRFPPVGIDGSDLYILLKPAECSSCPLSTLGEGFVPPFGSGQNGIALVGMAPEAEEVKKGEPFVGRAGSVLGLAMKIGGLNKADFLILNSIQCRPPDMSMNSSNWWLNGALSHCRTHRDPLLSRPDIHTIIALGNIPFKLLTGEDGIMTKRGYVYWNETYQKKVVGTFHPSFLGRGKMGLLQTLIFDLKVGPKKPLPVIPFDKLTLYPSPEVLKEWCRGVEGADFLVVDIETPYSAGKAEDDELADDPSSQIIRVSFALPDGRAITFPWMPGWIEVAREALLTGTPKVFWNADYDVPRLEINECQINGLIIDAMWLFHFLYPDLPRGLASVSTYYTQLPEWKSLSGSNPELYSALDSHATALDYLGIMNHLKEKGMWEVAWDHVVRLQVVLRKMHQRGLYINRTALEEFRTAVNLDINSLQQKLNQEVPQEVRPRSMVKAKHIRGRCHCLKQMIGKKGLPLKKLVATPGCETCRGSGWLPEIVNILNFNAGSKDQVTALIRALGHKVPTSSKKDEEGNRKETTEAKFLIQLARQHPEAPYKDVIEYRRMTKIRDTYLEWPMTIIDDERAFVRTKLGLDPATGRLSSQNPNMQNIPKEGPLAERFKKCIIPSRGHIICKRDYSSIEAILTGYFARDNRYIKLATAGIHTYNVARFKGIPVDISLSDTDLAKYLKGLKQRERFDETPEGENVSLYQRFKKAGHMINYGAKHVKLFNESPGVFKDLKEAYKIWKFIFSQNPSLRKWHKEIEAEVKKEHRIVTPYMYNRWIWDPGDLPKAIAMKPQSTAAAIIKEGMLLVDETEAGKYMILQVHDELVFDFPLGPGSCECHPDNTKTWEELDEEVRIIMERPLPRLGGMSLKTERSAGSDFSCH